MEVKYAHAFTQRRVGVVCSGKLDTPRRRQTHTNTHIQNVISGVAYQRIAAQRLCAPTPPPFCRARRQHNKVHRTKLPHEPKAYNAKPEAAAQNYHTKLSNEARKNTTLQFLRQHVIMATVHRKCVLSFDQDQCSSSGALRIQTRAIVPCP